MAEGSLVTEWGSQFSHGLWRYIRPSFRAAGQDSFADPPSQSEDMFESLLNVMPPMQGDLDRRWGYQLFNVGVGAPWTTTQPTPFVLWNDDPFTQRRLIYNTP